MTEKELNQLYWLNKEIETQKKRLKELKTLSQVKSQVITDMPIESGINDNVANYAIEIADLENEVFLNVQKRWYELRKIERYVDTIDDSEIRQIIRLRHMLGLTWDEIGVELKMDRRTASRKYYKYMKDAHNARLLYDIIQI